ncbi:MAG: hypothetical protein LQ342_002785 [Letrouitia transgressa]|nr:MAG: hypothetical protein LQ342_002785 [Letrouitia transgressa]
MVEIQDMTLEGAFDTAVKGAHFILHIASPLSYAHATWSNTVSSAVGILHPAHTHAGPQLCTFILTSSFASGFDPSIPAPRIFTEKDWNTYAETKARELEAQSVQGEELGRVLYPASKVLAERAVWAWKAKTDPRFAIATVNPTISIGPPVQPPSDPASLNETLKPMWNMMSGALSTLPPAKPLSSFVDIRDVSRLHIHVALRPSHSNGHRYLIATGRAPPQAMADVIRRFYPRYRDRVPLGRPGEGYRSDYAFPIKGE